MMPIFLTCKKNEQKWKQMREDWQQELQQTRPKVHPNEQGDKSDRFGAVLIAWQTAAFEPCQNLRMQASTSGSIDITLLSLYKT